MQYALPLYLLFLACVLVRHAVVSVTSSILKGPVFGDWLVNYSEGFMRRGLPGEVFFLLGKWLHISPLYFVPFVGLGLYAAILYSV